MFDSADVYSNGMAEEILGQAIKGRRDTDVVFINYWLYFFLVSWVTFGIYAIIQKPS